MKRFSNSMQLMAVVAAALLTTAAPSSAQETSGAVKDNSPKGEWAWKRQAGNDSVLCRLTIKEKDGKLSGIYKDNRHELKIQNAQMKDGSLSFEINPKPDDKSRLISFKGKVAKESIIGKMTYLVKDQPKSTDWKAERYDPSMAVLGKWSINFETPDGNKLNYEFEVTQKTKGIGLKFLGDNNSKVSKVAFKNGVLVFDSTQEYEGQPIEVEWDLGIDGDKIDGRLFYSFAEGEGELDVTGERVK